MFFGLIWLWLWFFVVVVGGLACNKTIGDQREQREKEKQNVVMVNKKS